MTEITDKQAAYIISNSEIPEEIINSGQRVAVVLTQDWCPQWLAMHRWLKSADKNGIRVFYLCYNRKPYFKEFMRVKENRWQNHSVPYIRYYSGADFITESNYIGQKTFYDIFSRKAELTETQ